jgi:transcriptional regulator with XRE-family HTH domain
MIQPAPESASVDIDGPEIRRRRKLLGENIAHFAERCGITDGYLSAIELERRRTVSPRVFGQICKAFGLTEKERPLLVRQQHPAVKA